MTLYQRFIFHAPWPISYPAIALRRFVRVIISAFRT
jgi:hypothetical protein